MAFDFKKITLREVLIIDGILIPNADFDRRSLELVGCSYFVYRVCLHSSVYFVGFICLTLFETRLPYFGPLYWLSACCNPPSWQMSSYALNEEWRRKEFFLSFVGVSVQQYVRGMIDSGVVSFDWTRINPRVEVIVVSFPFIWIS